MDRLIFLFIALFAQSIWAQDQGIVRVRLASQQNRILISGRSMTIQEQESVIQKIALPAIRQTLEVSLEKIKQKSFWKVKSQGSSVVRIFSSPYLSIRGELIEIDHKPGPDRLVLHQQQHGIDIIGFVPLRKYLYGVVGHEMPVGWPIEALKAQAVVARSYLFSIQDERQERSYEVDSTFLDQVYGNLESSHLSSEQISKVESAVDETANQILQDDSKRAAKTYYHADCGGKTSRSSDVFGTAGIEVEVVDQSCPTSPRAKWTFSTTKEILAHKLAQFFKQEDFLSQALSLAKIESVEGSLQDRIKTLRLLFQNGTSRLLPANEFRQILGFQNLRSTKFEVSIDHEKLSFRGSGFGHGVGLCQWGTRTLALHGQKYQEILKHYYPNLELNNAKYFQSKKGDGENRDDLFN